MSGVVEVARRRMHSLALRLKMLALVHGQAASSTTEAVALRAELAGVADFAKQLALVLGAVCRVERFVAKTCNTRSSHAVVDYVVDSCWMGSRKSVRDTNIFNNFNYAIERNCLLRTHIFVHKRKRCFFFFFYFQIIQYSKICACDRRTRFNFLTLRNTCHVYSGNRFRARLSSLFKMQY